MKLKDDISRLLEENSSIIDAIIKIFNILLKIIKGILKLALVIVIVLVGYAATEWNEVKERIEKLEKAQTPLK